MTRRELIAELASKQNTSKRQAEEWLDTFVGVVSSQVAKGNKVSITGFGVFDLGSRAARRGVDPRTGKEIQIPKLRMPRFRAGKRLKELVRK
ncbi:MAG: HU family DNA-binding protein, partial [Candidatus Saccharimonadales bacterium]